VKLGIVLPELSNDLFEEFKPARQAGGSVGGLDEGQENKKQARGYYPLKKENSKWT